MGAYVHFSVRFESHCNLTHSMGKLIIDTLDIKSLSFADIIKQYL
jgi:hypothetical protein